MHNLLLHYKSDVVLCAFNNVILSLLKENKLILLYAYNSTPRPILQHLATRSHSTDYILYTIPFIYNYYILFDFDVYFTRRFPELFSL